MKTLGPRLASLPAARVRTLDGKAGATPRIMGSTWMGIRVRILRRDGYLCVSCKAKGYTKLAKEIDHIVPLDDGGSNDDANLQSLCVPCHKGKSATEARRTF